MILGAGQLISAWILVWTLAEYRQERTLRGPFSVQCFPTIRRISLPHPFEALREIHLWLKTVVRFESRSPLQSDLKVALSRLFPQAQSTWFVVAVAIAIGLLCLLHKWKFGISARSLAALAVCSSQVSSASPGYYYSVVLVVLMINMSKKSSVSMPKAIAIILLSTPFFLRHGDTNWTLLNSQLLGFALLIGLTITPFVIVKRLDSGTHSKDLGPVTRNHSL